MSEKTIVVTMYGKNESVESISISLFDKTESYHSESRGSAIEYRNNINNLELTDNNWIYAHIAEENKKIILQKPLKLLFDIVKQLDDRAVQKVLREVDSMDLVKALKDADEETKEKIFKNTSKRATAMIQEDIEALHGVTKDDIQSSQNEIIEAIRHLSSTGEIVIAGSI
jgi:flagellar motor switch protein FliG